MYCSKCGKENSDNSKFCIACGNNLVDNVEFDNKKINNAYNNLNYQSQINFDNNPNQQQNLKKKKIIIVSIVVFAVIVLAILAILISNSVKNNYDYENDYSEETNLENTNFSYDYDTGYVLTDNLLDYQIKIGDIVYQFPMSIEDFKATGLQYSMYEDENETVSSGYGNSVHFVYPDGNSFYAELVNFTRSEVSLDYCHVVGITIDALTSELDGNTPIVLAKNITFGVSTIDDVKAAYGDPDDINEYEGTYEYVYGKDIYNQVTLGFNEENLLDKIKIENIVEPDDVVEQGVSDEIPQLVKNYTKPSSLGTNMASGVFELEGAVYKLPLPVSELLSNGWEIIEKSENSIAGLDQIYVTLKKGNCQLDELCINNYEEYEVPIENGVIISIDSARFAYGLEGKIVLPNEVYVSMDVNDFLNQVNGMDYTVEKQDFFDHYYFEDEHYCVRVTVENNQVTIVDSSWDGYLDY